MIFHEQFWLLLSKKSPKKFIEIELLYSVLRILLDPIKIPIKITAQLIDQYLEKIETHFNNQSNYEEKIKLWTSEDIVKHFKKLNLNNIAYMKIGYLKPKKFDEFQEVNFLYLIINKIKKIHRNLKIIHLHHKSIRHLFI